MCSAGRMAHSMHPGSYCPSAARTELVGEDPRLSEVPAPHCLQGPHQDKLRAVLLGAASLPSQHRWLCKALSPRFSPVTYVRSHARTPSAGPGSSTALLIATRSQILAVATTADETGVAFWVRELGIHSILTCFMPHVAVLTFHAS